MAEPNHNPPKLRPVAPDSWPDHPANEAPKHPAKLMRDHLPPPEPGAPMQHHPHRVIQPPHPAAPQPVSPTKRYQIAANISRHFAKLDRSAR